MNPYFDLNQLCNECKIHRNLHRTIMNEHLECFKYLIKEGQHDINEKKKLENTPIYNAIKSKNVEYLEILLKNGAMINETDSINCPLFILLFIEKVQNKKDIRKSVNLLLQAKAEFNNIISKTKYTPLFYVCKHQYTNLELFKFYIKNGANVNAIGPKSETILECIQQKKPEFMELILSAGANVNTLYSDFTPPLYKTMQVDNKYTFKKMDMLLKAGADINFKTPHGNTFLHIHSNMSRNIFNYNIVKWLLKNNIHINIFCTRYNFNAIEYLVLHQYWRDPPTYHMILCFIDLYASGEIMQHSSMSICKTWLSKDIFELLFPNEINLSLICRSFIRKYHINLYPHHNLRNSICELNLPLKLQNYLLFIDERSDIKYMIKS